MSSLRAPGAVPPPWVPDHHLRVRLFHGCLRQAATAMLSGGGSISHTRGRPDADFGRGFYVTTHRRQAENWAYKIHAGLPLPKRRAPGNHPVVLWLDVPRDDLAGLEALAFVRGDYDAEDYWSFVHHNRGSTAASAHHHERDRSGSPTWYDLVCGPVAAFWYQRVAVPDGDQFSFHTDAGVAVLNAVIRGGRSNVDYGVVNVTI